ncbi:hypothetical protein [Rhodococcus sp. Rp3]|nr:hypothetical protein [Rhodococcus sp. Rp3]MDC3728339.1 hypothetical protein [Rhodococcus sp. Rp3]
MAIGAETFDLSMVPEPEVVRAGTRARSGSDAGAASILGQSGLALLPAAT